MYKSFPFQPFPGGTVPAGQQVMLLLAHLDVKRDRD